MATSPITPPTDNPLLDHPLIKAAFAAGQQHAQNNTGISNPPDGGAVRSILPPQQEAHAMPPIQDPAAHPAVPPIGMHPQQQAGLQTESPHVSSTILPPPTTSAAPAGSMQAPPPLAGPSRGTIPGEEAETQRLIQTGSGASQIKNPIGRTLAEIGSGVEHIVAPGLARVTPGTEDRNQNLIQQSEVNTGRLQGEQKADTANTEQQAQTGLIQANTGKTQEETAALPEQQAEKQRMEDAQISNLLHPQAKTDFEAWRQQNPDTPVSEWIKLQGSPAREQQAELKHETLAQQAQMADSARRDRETFHADSERDRALTRQQMQANAADKKAKPTADEQKKADLVDNLNENLGVVEEILHRRPDLFGPIAGRMTSLKNSFGTSDPDIAALESAQHQLGMVQQGVHGMRSATGMQGAVDAIMNGFRNSPEAMQRSIDTVRNSAKTFSNAVGEKGQPGVGGIPAAGPKVGEVDGGYRFKGGDPGKQTSWEKVK